MISIACSRGTCVIWERRCTDGASSRRSWKTFPKDARICVVYLERQPLAAGFLYGFQNTLEIPWASSDRRYNQPFGQHAPVRFRTRTRVSRGISGLRLRTVESGQPDVPVQGAVGRSARAALLVPLVRRWPRCPRLEPGELALRSRHQDVEEAAGGPYASHRSLHRQEHPLRIHRFRLVAPAGAPLPVRTRPAVSAAERRG